MQTVIGSFAVDYYFEINLKQNFVNLSSYLLDTPKLLTPD